MNSKIDYISSTLNFLTICCLCVVIFFGTNLSTLLDIYKNTNTVIAILAFIVCLRCSMIIMLPSKGGNICFKSESRSVGQMVGGSVFIMFIGIALFHTMAVIYGAPLFETVAETFYLSCLLACTTLLPCCCILGPDMNSWYKVLFKNCPDNMAETTVRMTTICSVIGAWAGAFPIPLDWDRPWQVWPISCVIGAVLGYSAGLILSPLQSIKDKHASKLKVR